MFLSDTCGVVKLPCSFWEHGVNKTCLFQLVSMRLISSSMYNCVGGHNVHLHNGQQNPSIVNCVQFPPLDTSLWIW